MKEKKRTFSKKEIEECFHYSGQCVKEVTEEGECIDAIISPLGEYGDRLWRVSFRGKRGYDKEKSSSYGKVFDKEIEGVEVKKIDRVVTEYEVQYETDPNQKVTYSVSGNLVIDPNPLKAMNPDSPMAAVLHNIVASKNRPPINVCIREIWVIETGAHDIRKFGFDLARKIEELLQTSSED